MPRRRDERRRGAHWALAALVAVALCSTPLGAQFCDNPFGIDPGGDGPNVNACQLFDFCGTPLNEPPFYVIGETTLEVRIPYDAPGNHQQNSKDHTRIAWFDTAQPPEFCDHLGCPGALTICGDFGFTRILNDRGETWIRIPKPECEDLETDPNLGMYSASVVNCFHNFVCTRKHDVPDIDLSVGTVGKLLGCDAGLDLSIGGSCPGEITVTASGGTPDGIAGIIFSDAEGSDPLTGGPCAGTPTELESPRLLGVASFDENGELSLTRNAPAGACGRPTQLVDGSTCTVSNLSSP